MLGNFAALKLVLALLYLEFTITLAECEHDGLADYKVLRAELDLFLQVIVVDEQAEGEYG